ncbi:MAG: hypothetical protein DK306_001399 [Chloroflexi bacterium]|nr:MAG: hypothetical protein DK306_001399 [Chloroflexota bacterium]
MSRHTATALIFAAMSLAIAAVGLLLMLAPEAAADQGLVLQAAPASADEEPAMSPAALPSVGSGGLADTGGDAPALERRGAASHGDAPLLATSFAATAVLGLAGWAVVRRWFSRSPEAG